MDDLSQTVASLSCVLLNGSKRFDPSVEEAKTKPQSRSQSEEDVGRHTERAGVMSLDISKYELQMLEQQARQEQLEEECILAFQVTAAFSSSVHYRCDLLMFHDYGFPQTQQASSPNNSNDMESDEDEMMKVKLSHERKSRYV